MLPVKSNMSNILKLKFIFSAKPVSRKGYKFFPFYWKKRSRIRNFLVCFKFLRLFEAINQVHLSVCDDNLLLLIANGYGGIFFPKERVVEFQAASGSKSVLLLLA